MAKQLGIGAQMIYKWFWEQNSKQGQREKIRALRSKKKELELREQDLCFLDFAKQALRHGKKQPVLKGRNSDGTRMDKNEILSAIKAY